MKFELRTYNPGDKLPINTIGFTSYEEAKKQIKISKHTVMVDNGNCFIGVDEESKLVRIIYRPTRESSERGKK